MIHHCYEGVPGFVEILDERNPSLNAVILEGLQLKEEMRKKVMENERVRDERRNGENSGKFRERKYE